MISQAFRIRDVWNNSSIACLVFEEGAGAMENDIYTERQRRMEYISTLLSNNDSHNTNNSDQRVFVMKSPMKVHGSGKSANGVHTSSAAIQADGKILVSNKYSRSNCISERIESKYLHKVFYYWRGIYLAHYFYRMNLQAKVLRRWKRFMTRKHENVKNIQIQGTHMISRNETISRQLLSKQSSSKSQMMKQRAQSNRQLPNVLIVESMSIPSASTNYKLTNNSSSNRKSASAANNSSAHKNGRTPVRVRNKSLFAAEDPKQQAPSSSSKVNRPVTVNIATEVVKQEVEQAPPPPPAQSQHSPSVPRPTSTTAEVIEGKPVFITKQAQEEEVVSSLSSLSVVETAQRKDQEENLQQQQAQQQQQSPRHVSKLSRITAGSQQHNRHLSVVPPRSDSPLMQAVQASNRLNQVINFLRERQERQHPQTQQQQSPRKYNPLQQAPHSVPTSYRYDQTVDDSEEDLDVDDAYDNLELVPNMSMPLPFEEEESDEDEGEAPPPPPMIAPPAPLATQAASDIFFLTSPLLDSAVKEEDAVVQHQPRSQLQLEEKRIPSFSPTAKTTSNGLHSNDNSPLKSSSMSQEQVDTRLDLYRKRRLFGVLRRQLNAFEHRWEERQAMHKYRKAHLKQTYLHRWRHFKQRQQLRRDKSLNNSYPLYPAAMTLSQGSGQHFMSQYSLRVAWNKFLHYTQFTKKQRGVSYNTRRFHMRKVMRAALYEWRIFYVLSRKKKVIARPLIAPPPSEASSRLTSPEASKTFTSAATAEAVVLPSPSQTSPVHQSTVVVVGRRRSVPEPPLSPPIVLHSETMEIAAKDDVEAAAPMILSPVLIEAREERVERQQSPPLPSPPQEQQQQQQQEEAAVVTESDMKSSAIEESSEDTTIIPNFRHDPVYLPPPLPVVIPAHPTENADNENLVHAPQPVVGALPVTELQEAFAAWIEEEESDFSHEEYDDFHDNDDAINYQQYYEDADGDGDEDNNYDDYDAIKAFPPSSSPALFIAHDGSDYDDDDEEEEMEEDDEEEEESDYEDYEANDHTRVTVGSPQPPLQQQRHYLEIIQEVQQVHEQQQEDEQPKPVVVKTKPKMGVNVALQCIFALVILWRGRRLHRRKLLKQGLFYLTQYTLRETARRNECMILRQWHEVQVVKQTFMAWKKTII